MKASKPVIGPHSFSPAPEIILGFPKSECLRLGFQKAWEMNECAGVSAGYALCFAFN